MGSSEYVATVAISGTNAVMPTVTPVLVKFAKYDNPLHTRIHMTVGFFLGRMLTLGTVFLAYYGCFTGADVIVPKKPLQVCGGSDVNFAIGAQDHFAQTLLLLVLIEFVLPKLINLGQVLLKLVVLPLLLRRPKGEIYLKVEKQVIHLVYFQSLFWMLMPFLPWASALMCLCFLGDFFFDQFFLLRFCSKAAAGTSTATQARIFLRNFHVAFLVFGLLFMGIWVFQGTMTHLSIARDGTAVTGPFCNPDFQADPVGSGCSAASGDGTAPASPLQELYFGSSFFESLLTLLLSVPMMLLFVYVLYKEKGERGFRGAVLQEYAAVQASSLKMQMGAQQVRLTKLKRENDRLKEQVKQQVNQMLADEP
uniref:Uncharacterized protein n=3 Tax=Emiliania huxleyi TaxID=2903 RepID=A0A7S3S296_EMIHU